MKKDALSEGFGLSAKFPGDKNIARHDAVILNEDFETGGLSDLRGKWTDISNKASKALAFDTLSPAESAGRRSIKMTATLDENHGGHLFALLPRASDVLFARFYVRFEPDAGYIHHFVWMGAHNPPVRWPNPQAGVRPRGDDRVSVGIEPHGGQGRLPAPGAWSFYAYWHEMKKSADGKFWGAAIAPPPAAAPLLVPKGRWQCVEFMTRMNSAPDRSDGELALWLDGKLAMHVAPGVRRGPWTGMGFFLPGEGGAPFEGFRFRTTSALKLNNFWLEHYVTPAVARRSPRPKPTNSVWFDDVVVATEYIGPIKR